MPETFKNAFITTDIHLQDKNYHSYYLVNSLKEKTCIDDSLIL